MAEKLEVRYCPVCAAPTREYDTPKHYTCGNGHVCRIVGAWQADEVIVPPKKENETWRDKPSLL